MEWTLSRSQGPYTDSLTQGIRADRKAENKPPSIKVLKANECHTLATMAMIKAIPKDLNETSVMVPTTTTYVTNRVFAKSHESYWRIVYLSKQEPLLKLF